jgi:hypothetical protein
LSDDDSGDVCYTPLMARFVILLLLFIGTPLLAQTITTPVEESFPHTHIRAQAYGFSYPNEFQNKSIETRYRLTFKRAFRPYEGFQYAYHVDLWGLFPREAEDLFDFPEAYLSYRASPLTLKLGRILPEWGTVPFYSPVKRIFSKFSIDHLSYQRDGLLGLQAAYHQRRFSYELFWSPAFIPDRGR